jgi:hypothetical protein
MAWQDDLKAMNGYNPSMSFDDNLVMYLQTMQHGIENDDVDPYIDSFNSELVFFIAGQVDIKIPLADLPVAFDPNLTAKDYMETHWSL